jgi:RNA polymerase sigma factor (TIGR02999 family)
MASPPNEVSQLLHQWSEGDETALPQLAALVEAELRRLAQQFVNREPSDQTLAPSDLINEAWLRLIDGSSVKWENRAHFFGAAANLMRRILVDHARHRRALKHGGEALRVSLTQAENVARELSADVIALNDALDTLAAFDERKSRIVELRFFGGMSEEETARALKIPLRTLQREWSLARAWLYNELSKDRGYDP